MKFEIFVVVLIAGFCWSIPTIPDLEDFEALQQRCDKKGGNGTFTKVLAAKDDTQICLNDLIDIEKFKKDLNEAKKTGSMDEVFNKYCKKRPDAKACAKKLYDALEPCLEEDEKKAINFTSNLLTEIGDFACAKEGDRLAMFVAEGGPDCIQSRSEGVQKCVNQTLKFNPENVSTNSIPKLIDHKKACDDLATIQTCVVAELEKCEESTPANIIDALFKFVKRTACKNIKRRSLF